MHISDAILFLVEKEEHESGLLFLSERSGWLRTKMSLKHFGVACCLIEKKEMDDFFFVFLQGNYPLIASLIHSL